MPITWRRGLHRVFIILACFWVLFAISYDTRDYTRHANKQLAEAWESYRWFVNDCPQTYPPDSWERKENYCEKSRQQAWNDISTLEPQTQLSYQFEHAFLPPRLTPNLIVALIPPALLYGLVSLTVFLVRWTAAGFSIKQGTPFKPTPPNE